MVIHGITEDGEDGTEETTGMVVDSIIHTEDLITTVLITSTVVAGDSTTGVIITGATIIGAITTGATAAVGVIMFG